MPLQALATTNGGKIEISAVEFGDTAETANVVVDTVKALRELYKIAASAKPTPLQSRELYKIAGSAKPTPVQSRELYIMAGSAKPTPVQSVPAQHAASASSTKRQARSEHTSDPVSHCGAKKPRVTSSSQSSGAQVKRPYCKPVMLTNAEDKSIVKIFNSGTLASQFLECTATRTSLARNTAQVVKGWHISDAPQGVPIPATAPPSGAVALTATTAAVPAAAAHMNDVVALLDEVGNGLTERVWPLLQEELVTELYLLAQLSRLDLQALGIKLGDALRVITAVGHRDVVL